MPLVSVIVPVYNAEKYIKECIKSIINQTYKNIEIILVDDGSTDNSLKILNEYKEDTRVRVITQENQGAPAARNNGFNVANGEYVIFFDADDIMEKEQINLLVENSKGVDLVVGNYQIIDESGNIIYNDNKKLDSRLLAGNTIYDEAFLISPFPDNKLYKASILKKYNIKFVDVKIGQDINFFLKYLSVIKNLRFIDNNICYYRIVNNSISHSYNFKIFDIVKSIEDVEEFYIKNDKEELIDYYLSGIKYYHYIGQMNKLFRFDKKSDRKQIIDFFEDKINKVDFSKCKLDVKTGLIKLKFKFVFKNIYISNFCKKIYNKKHEKDLK